MCNNSDSRTNILRIEVLLIENNDMYTLRDRECNIVMMNTLLHMLLYINVIFYFVIIISNLRIVRENIVAFL